jgi:hypothetical protein
VIPFEFTASDEASGNVAVMSSTTAGVRVTSGKVTVRNLKTSESFVLTKGQEQLFGLQNGVHAKPLAEVASNMPLPIPAPGTPAPGAPAPGAPAPQTPAGRTSNPGLAMDAGGWLALIGVGAITGVAVWAIVEARNNRDDVRSLRNQLNCTQSLSAISGSVAQQSSALALASSLASQAQLALLAAGNPSGGAGRFQTLQTQITAALNQLNALQVSIQNAQAGTCSNTVLASLLSQEEALRGQTNSLLSQLTSALNAFSTITGVPSSGTVPAPIVGPPIASPSVPA